MNTLLEERGVMFIVFQSILLALNEITLSDIPTERFSETATTEDQILLFVSFILYKNFYVCNVASASLFMMAYQPLLVI